MNTSNPALLSQGSLRQLYFNSRSEISQPVLQLIDFQQSQVNDKEIMYINIYQSIRLSDGTHFVDCTLSGNYQIIGPCISETKNTTTLINFKKMHIIKLVDYFNKIDQSRICKLKIIVRKIMDIAPATQIIGNPLQIQQFMIKNKKVSSKIEQEHNNKIISQYTLKKGHHHRDQEVHSGKSQDTCIKLENVQEANTQIQQVNHHLYNSNNANSVVKTKKELISQDNASQSQGLGQPLTHHQILSGKEGFLIGRLIRFKTTRKQTKDGPMTVCYLGVLDKYDDLIRIHLAGRLAMNNQKTLKRNKCYYIRGFDLVTIKNSGVQIRLKDRQYKILQIHNEDYIRQLRTDYFHWDHQNEIQNEYVDVIGIVEDIQNKTTYNSNNQIDNKSVIRIVLRNKYKSIRISFWSDQMKNLESFNLKKKEAIIFEDVRKKQSKYYDFGFQSSLTKLVDHPSLMERYEDLIPSVTQEYEPQNIRELSKIYEEEPNNSKLRTITAYLVHCPENNITYRLCDDCKKKVERSTNECHECGSQNLVFKYNCRLEFSDSTGSIICILFDSVAHKLLGRTANEISELTEEQIQQIFEPLFYRPYTLTVEDRNQRLIMRHIEAVPQNSQVGLTKSNLSKIKEVTVPSELWVLGIKM